MKRLSTPRLLSSLLLGVLVVCNVHAADPATASTPQRTRMGACNADAGDRKGDERKAFMKSCLSSKSMAQREKMKQCNADATGKSGAERKQFMKSCLSAKK